ncbi:2,3-bisphosphoglycerate-independent phosphoglycerate mutase, archaeal type [Methanosarcina siciliae HI350]|uniref:2,3-bisphosphoglycerate-independent phosphoglycerate mutase n=1 Tax=Methanosarcina siciliae HI350 TaxID=1434119 RepID=A0A0E3PDN3_9EURY|nr:2,3-bisphosphoglycerate-independent phosphoglycerate mutase [Methanosarcina siciliae]AKB32217.1 2,3-bisphosphoglycerate-independent phosphoglycerate mutase, archaeal type [Methanosarcina siciliae HI350]
MLKKCIVVIFDGLGDRPISELNNKTPLEAAVTPHLDYMAANGESGLMYSLGRGVRPGSDVSHMEIFGYPISKYYTGRGPIEVAGIGIKHQEGDVAFRGNVGTVDEDWNIVDRRAGRIKDVRPFAEALDGMTINGVEFIVKAGTAHRIGLIMRGHGKKISSSVSDADPHDAGLPLHEVVPTDDTPEAKFTAEVLNKFMKRSYDILKDHPLNIERRNNGELEGNFILLRGPGQFPSMPSFKEKYHMKVCCIAGGGLYRGIGSFLGMDIIDLPGTTALADTDVDIKFRTAVEKLSDYDFVFVHVKGTDSMGEDGNYIGKRDFITKIDKAAKHFLDIPEETLVVFTADHSTPCELKAHSADPVPVMFYAKSSLRVDDVTQFSERAAAKGGLGVIEGKDLMPQIENLLGKLHLIGA